MSRGFIQWKGTDVCFDLNCDCGCLSHYDGEYMYQIICPRCGQIYECSQDIKLIPLVAIREDLPSPAMGSED